MISTAEFLSKYSPMHLAPDAQGGAPSGLKVLVAQLGTAVLTFAELLTMNGVRLVDGANALWIMRRGDDTSFGYALDGSAAGKTPNTMFRHATTMPLILTSREMINALVLEGTGAGPTVVVYIVQYFTGRTGSRR